MPSATKSTAASDLEKYIESRSRVAGSRLIAGGHPYLQQIEDLRERLEAAGRPFVNFSNYDYLGLAHDSRISDAACDAARRIGVGAGASRLVGGERRVHAEMEREISDFIGVEDTLALVSGYMTNLSFVGHLLTKGDLIIVDEYSHNSIMMGAEMSRASLMKFHHNDLNHLETLLKTHREQYDRVLIIVEGLYSMDGDIPDLPSLVDIKEQYKAWLMVDEAHSIGVLGRGGRGLTEYWDIPVDKVEFIIGTLSKAFISVGGFICARKSVTHWLRFTLPAFVYSVGISPVIASVARTAVQVVGQEPWRLAKLQENSLYFAERATARGFDIGTAVGAAVVPVLFDDPRECMAAAMALLEAGYFAPPIMQVAVSRSRPRLRFFICASHTREDMDGCLDALAALR
jgi:8-amino-7-oxononanoate synthase